MWQRRADGSWRRTTVHRGGWQGERLTQVVFALDVDNAIEEAGFGPDVQAVGIADDFLPCWQRRGSGEQLGSF